MMLGAIVLVGMLSEVLSVLLDAGLSGSSLPKSIPVVLVALISASPEILTALRAAQNNRMQTTVNIALGLGASNYTYACATARETQADWLHGLTGALHFIGGVPEMIVPEMIVPDCPKALVTDADRYEPLINWVAQDCARHYGTVILPARPRHPQDKAMAEVGVQIIERWILARLRHRRFFSLDELNQAIQPLLDDLNRRPFQKKDAYRSRRRELWQAAGTIGQD